MRNFDVMLFPYFSYIGFWSDAFAFPDNGIFSASVGLSCISQKDMCEKRLKGFVPLFINYIDHLTSSLFHDIPIFHDEYRIGL